MIVRFYHDVMMGDQHILTSNNCTDGRTDRQFDVVHTPTGIHGEASERRSQADNRRVALFRLRLELALELRRDAAPDAPSELWRSRCRKRRLSVSASHEDFPALLAEALDVIHLADNDVKAASETLACSATQLIKLLKLAPRALQKINAARSLGGLRPLL